MGNRYIGTNDHDKYKMAEVSLAGLLSDAGKNIFMTKI